MKGKMNISELLDFLPNFNFWQNARLYPAFYQWLELCADAVGWDDTEEVKAGMTAWDFRQLQCKVSTWIDYGVSI